MQYGLQISVDSCSSRRVIQRRPQVKKWISVPYKGNVKGSVSTPKVRITHVLEIFPENRAIVKTRRRSALGAEVAQEHVGHVVVEGRRRWWCRIRPEVIMMKVDPFRKFVE